MRYAKLIVSVILILGLIACSGGDTQTQNGSSGDDYRAPDLTLRNTDGGFVELADYKGKVVMIGFWATWCKFCRKEIPHLKEIQKEYREKDFTILGISLDSKGEKVVKPFVKKYEFNYPVLYGNKKAATAFGKIKGLPTKFILDRQGRVKEKIVGMQSKKYLIQKFKPYL